MQVINDPGLAGLWGQSLSQGLQVLAQHKTQQIQRGKIAEGIQQLLPGTTPKQADAMSYLPDTVLSALVKSKMSSGSNEAMSKAIESAMGIGNEQQQQQVSPNQRYEEQAQAQVPQEQNPIEQPRTARNVPVAEQYMMNGLTKATEAQKPSTQPQQRSQEVIPQQPLHKQEAIQQQNPYKNLNPEQMLKVANLRTNRENALWKATEKSRNKMEEKAEYADTAIRSLDQIIDIAKKHGTIDPTAYALLDKAGFPMEGFLSDDELLINKSKGVFFKGLKADFGARITDNELNNWLKTIPTLMMTDSGKIIVAENMKLGMKADQKRNEIKDQIIERYGYPPRNLNSLVEHEAKPFIDSYAAEFKEKMKDPAGTSSDEMPSASLYPGRKITDSFTGKTLVSNGKDWV